MKRTVRIFLTVLMLLGITGSSVLAEETNVQISEVNHAVTEKEATEAAQQTENTEDDNGEDNEAAVPENNEAEETPFAIGGQTGISVDLTMKYNVILPDMTFNYEVNSKHVEEDTEKDGVPVYSGIGQPELDKDSVTMTYDDVILQVSLFEEVPVINPNYYCTTSIPVVIDFSGIQFNKPGIYRYSVEEIPNPEYTWIAYDTKSKSHDNKRTLDVTVIETDGGLAVSEYTIYGAENTQEEIPEAEEATENTEEETREEQKTNTGAFDDYHFVHSYTTSDIRLTHETQGTDEEKQETLIYRLELNNLVPNSTVQMLTYNQMENGAYLIEPLVSAENLIDADENGHAVKELKLPNGKAYTICGLPMGATFSLSQLETEIPYKVNDTQVKEAVYEGVVENTEPVPVHIVTVFHAGIADYLVYIIAGAVVLIAAVVLVIIMIKKRKKNGNQSNNK